MPKASRSTAAGRLPALPAAAKSRRSKLIVGDRDLLDPSILNPEANRDRHQHGAQQQPSERLDIRANPARRQEKLPWP